MFCILQFVYLMFLVDIDVRSYSLVVYLCKDLGLTVLY